MASIDFPTKRHSLRQKRVLDTGILINFTLCEKGASCFGSKKTCYPLEINFSTALFSVVVVLHFVVSRMRRPALY